MKASIATRVALDLILALCVLFGWWFLALPLGVIGLWRFRYFAEILAAGFAYDALYGAGLPVGLWGYAATLTAAALAFGAFSIKSSLR